MRQAEEGRGAGAAESIEAEWEDRCIAADEEGAAEESRTAAEAAAGASTAETDAEEGKAKGAAAAAEAEAATAAGGVSTAAVQVAAAVEAVAVVEASPAKVEALEGGSAALTGNGSRVARAAPSATILDENLAGSGEERPGALARGGSTAEVAEVSRAVPARECGPTAPDSLAMLADRDWKAESAGVSARADYEEDDEVDEDAELSALGKRIAAAEAAKTARAAEAAAIAAATLITAAIHRNSAAANAPSFRNPSAAHRDKDAQTEGSSIEPATTSSPSLLGAPDLQCAPPLPRLTIPPRATRSAASSPRRTSAKASPPFPERSPQLSPFTSLARPASRHASMPSSPSSASPFCRTLSVQASPRSPFAYYSNKPGFYSQPEHSFSSAAPMSLPAPSPPRTRRAASTPSLALSLDPRLFQSASLNAPPLSPAYETELIDGTRRVITIRRQGSRGATVFSPAFGKGDESILTPPHSAASPSESSTSTGSRELALLSKTSTERSSVSRSSSSEMSVATQSPMAGFLFALLAPSPSDS
eukprot:TRINITY_DN3339_c0_g2_i1.p1 TRINITY_DN3339_c0_g2~~TRINITY_DN3339_c0_g2_i1.p1  ORF type:complete len:597 (-),score=129.16 TRINITY_DN3339_c0_g2_i1:70-1671(-)